MTDSKASLLTMGLLIMGLLVAVVLIPMAVARGFIPMAGDTGRLCRCPKCSSLQREKKYILSITCRNCGEVFTVPRPGR